MTQTTSPATRPRRRPRADGERTRSAILRAAASLATVDGLEGLSIGHLAAAIGMSKSGLYAHFGSKQELQLATVQEAGQDLRRRSRPARPGRPAPGWPSSPRSARRSSSTCSDAPSPAAASSPARPWRWAPAPARSRRAVAAFQAGFVDLLRGFAATAIEQNELPARRGPRPARLRAERDHPGRRRQLRPARQPRRPGPGPPGRAPPAGPRQRRQRRRTIGSRPGRPAGAAPPSHAAPHKLPICANSLTEDGTKPPAHVRRFCSLGSTGSGGGRRSLVWLCRPSEGRDG